MQDAENRSSAPVEPVPPRSARSTARKIAKSATITLLVLSVLLAVPALVLFWYGRRSAGVFLLLYLAAFALFNISAFVWVAIDVALLRRIRFSLRTLVLVVLGLGACATVVVEFYNDLMPWGIPCLYAVIIAAALGLTGDKSGQKQGEGDG